MTRRAVFTSDLHLSTKALLDDSPRETYLDTGTWASESGPLPLAITKAAGAPTARLVHFADGMLS